MRVVNVTVSRPSDPSRAERDPLGDAIRGALVRAAAHVLGEDPEVIGRRRYGERGSYIARAGVGASDRADLGTAPYENQEWVAGQADPAIILALPDVRRVDPNVRVLTPDSRARGFFVLEGAPAPVSRQAVRSEPVGMKRITVMTAVTNEALVDPRSVPRLVDDHRRAFAAGVNFATFSAAAEGVAPAGLLNGATTIPSSGNAATDFGALVEAFTGNLASAAVLCDTTTGAQLALSGAFQRVRVAGQGDIAGLPQWASVDFERDSSGGFLCLVDQSAISLAFSGVEIGRSRDTTLFMSDAPGSEATAVSMFQNELTALKLTAHINWRLSRPAVVVSGINYAVS
jgi:hypothetical protein